MIVTPSDIQKRNGGLLNNNQLYQTTPTSIVTTSGMGTPKRQSRLIANPNKITVKNYQTMEARHDSSDASGKGSLHNRFSAFSAMHKSPTTKQLAHTKQRDDEAVRLSLKAASLHEYKSTNGRTNAASRGKQTNSTEKWKNQKISSKPSFKQQLNRTIQPGMPAFDQYVEEPGIIQLGMNTFALAGPVPHQSVKQMRTHHQKFSSSSGQYLNTKDTAPSQIDFNPPPQH